MYILKKGKLRTDLNKEREDQIQNIHKKVMRIKEIMTEEGTE